MEKLRRENRNEARRPRKSYGKLLVEGLASLTAAAMISACTASASVSLRSGTATTERRMTPTLNAGEIRLRREGTLLRAELREITAIECNAHNSCTTTSESVSGPTLTFETYDPEMHRYQTIEGCPNEEQACDLSHVPEGTRIRVRFVPRPDFSRPMRGCDTETTR